MFLLLTEYERLSSVKSETTPHSTTQKSVQHEQDLKQLLGEGDKISAPTSQTPEHKDTELQESQAETDKGEKTPTGVVETGDKNRTDSTENQVDLVKNVSKLLISHCQC